MEFEVLPRLNSRERQHALHTMRYLLNEQDKAILESMPTPSSVDDEDWYEAALQKFQDAKRNWHGPSVLAWVTKKLGHETI